MTLREYLEKVGETQAAFARRLGLDRVIVNRIVNGRRPASGRYLAAILKATAGQVSLASLGHPDAG